MLTFLILLVALTFLFERCVMARLARSEVFDPDEVAIGHFDNRTTRRCFLMGEDPISRKKLDHRKVWIEEYLRELAGCDVIRLARVRYYLYSLSLDFEIPIGCRGNLG